MLRRLVRGRRVLLVGRAAEQGSVALASFVLAARLGVDAFAPVSVLLVFHSFAQSFADQGLAIRVLAAPGEVPASREQLDDVVRRNVALAPVAALVVALASDAGVATVLGAALLWTVAGVTAVLRACELKADRPRPLVTGDLAGAVIVLAGAALAAVERDHATAIVLATLVVRHAVDAAVCRGGLTVLTPGAPPSPLGAVVLSQLLAFAIANVDYLLVGALLGGEALAVYLIAFRAASAIPAQLAAVTTRTAMVDLSRGPDAERQHAYDRYVTRLVGLGALGAAATAGVAPLLPVVLGDEWDDARRLVMVLAVAIPWRLVIGIAGGLFLVADRASELVRLEIVRLLAYSAVIAVATQVDLLMVAVALVCADVVATLVLHALGSRRAALAMPRWMLGAPVAAGGALLVLALALT